MKPKVIHSDPNQICATNYSTKIIQTRAHWIQFERTHNWLPNSTEKDVFGDCWSIAMANFVNNQVGIRRYGKVNYLNGPKVFLIPPHSIIEWVFKGGTIFWQGILSSLKPPINFPIEPWVVELPDNQLIPTDIDELSEFIGKNSLLLQINKIETNSAVAQKLKNIIDHNWKSETSISDFCDDLGFNHAVADRAFKACFGLSPITYRNTKRILDGAHKLMLGQGNVTDIAFEVGFSGLDNFNKQFKRFMNATPSRFIHDKTSLIRSPSIVGHGS